MFGHSIPYRPPDEPTPDEPNPDEPNPDEPTPDEPNRTNQPPMNQTPMNQPRTEKRSCGFRILSYHKKAWSNIAFVDHASLCFFFSHEKEKRRAYARHDITGRRKGNPQAIQRRRFTYPEKPTLYWSPASVVSHHAGEVTTLKKSISRFGTL